MNYVRQLKQVAVGGMLSAVMSGCAVTAGGELGGGMFSVSCMQSGNQYYGSYRWAINHLIVGTEVQHTIIQHAAETACATGMPSVCDPDCNTVMNSITSQCTGDAKKHVGICPACGNAGIPHSV